MKLTLPSKGVLTSTFPSVISLTKKNRLLFLGFTLLTLSIVTQAQTQTEPEVIKDWDNLEEADFYFDVYYRIVRCDEKSDPEIHLIAFNEGGIETNVGFDLLFKDKNGKKADHKIEKFDIPFGATFKTSCENDDYSFLKFKVPEGLDIDSLTIDITYNK